MSKAPTEDDDEGGRVSSEIGPWAMVPAWVLTKKLTPGELVTYVALRSFADRGGDAHPRAEKIAKRANLALGTTRNAIQGLRKKGLIRTSERYRADGSLAGLDYFMFDIDPSPVAEVEPRRTGAKGGPKPRSEAGTPTDVPPSTGSDGTPQNTGAGYPTDVGGSTSTDAGVSTSKCTQEHTNEHTMLEHPSEPASQVRPDDADAKVAQTTIDGVDEDLGPQEPTIRDLANEIARRWIRYWADKGTPIIGPGPKVLHARMVAAVKGALEQGYSFDEIGRALNRIGRNTIPSLNVLGMELAAGRGQVPQQQRYSRGQGAMAGTNRHIDDISEQERRARNPLRNAVLASDCVDREGARA